jgi:membrane protease YdiL (CAAX protease family)
MFDQSEPSKTMNDKSGVNTSATTTTGKRNRIIDLLHEVGLMHAPRCYHDYRFYIVLLAAAFVLWLAHDLLPHYTHRIEFHWKLWLSLIIWQPVIEEILFRGILQGQLIKTSWGRRSWLNISAANIVTSIAFVIIHLVNNPPLFSISVIVPSLLFGYFRDKCNSVYPAILLHIAFNAFGIVFMQTR